MEKQTDQAWILQMKSWTWVINLYFNTMVAISYSVEENIAALGFSPKLFLRSVVPGSLPFTSLFLKFLLPTHSLLPIAGNNMGLRPKRKLSWNIKETKCHLLPSGAKQHVKDAATLWQHPWSQIARVKEPADGTKILLQWHLDPTLTAPILAGDTVRIPPFTAPIMENILVFVIFKASISVFLKLPWRTPIETKWLMFPSSETSRYLYWHEAAQAHHAPNISVLRLEQQLANPDEK